MQANSGTNVFRIRPETSRAVKCPVAVSQGFREVFEADNVETVLEARVGGEPCDRAFRQRCAIGFEMTLGQMPALGVRELREAQLEIAQDDATFPRPKSVQGRAEPLVNEQRPVER